jgi:hypothetical protein
VNGFTPGGIRCPEAYAQGKMLDHSWWYGQMARGITPSDIDMVIESYGCFLFCELSRSTNSLYELSRGQRLMLVALSRIQGVHAVAILRHELFSQSKAVCTATDIVSARVYFHGGTENCVLNGDSWRGFASHWTRDPAGAVRDWLSAKEATHGR